VVIAMIAMRVMEVTGDAVIDVITVRNGLVTTPRAMDMTHIVTAAAVAGRAAVRVFARDFDNVLVHMSLMRVVQVTIMEIIHMPVMAHRGVATIRAMLMGVAGVNIRGTGRHHQDLF
jgi:hypothetical protein